MCKPEEVAVPIQVNVTLTDACTLSLLHVHITVHYIRDKHLSGCVWPVYCNINNMQ